jgi:nitroreductase
MVRSILKIPSSKRVELIITLGYPAKEHREKRRKPLSEIVSNNKY